MTKKKMRFAPVVEHFHALCVMGIIPPGAVSLSRPFDSLEAARDDLCEVLEKHITDGECARECLMPDVLEAVKTVKGPEIIGVQNSAYAFHSCKQQEQEGCERYVRSNVLPALVREQVKRMTLEALSEQPEPAPGMYL